MQIKYTMIIEEEAEQNQVKGGDISSIFGDGQNGAKTPPDSMSFSTQETKKTPSKRVALPSVRCSPYFIFNF